MSKTCKKCDRTYDDVSWGFYTWTYKWKDGVTKTTRIMVPCKMCISSSHAACYRKNKRIKAGCDRSYAALIRF
jgi:hypothetical protein